MENFDMFNAATAQLTFHDFLDRMRHPSAADLVRSIKNFIGGYLSNPPDPERGSSSVQEFLKNTEEAFKAHSLWAGATEDELESSGEGLEKYLMTKLFNRSFAPLPDEAELDRKLTEKMKFLQHFIRPEHLDIPKNLQNETSWLLAQKELQKINTYKAPRDKLVCILNCCRVISNLLNVSMATNDNPPGADEFLPVLIYVVIKANPPQLHSNLLYIRRFRRQSRLTSEAAYLYTNLLSASSFIENLNSSSLSIDPAEFEKQMQAAGTAADGLNMNTAIVQPLSSKPSAVLNTSSTKQKAPKAEDLLTGASAIDGDHSVPFKSDDQVDVPQAHNLIPPMKTQLEPDFTKGQSVEKLQEAANAHVLEADKNGQLSKTYPFLYACAGDLRVMDVESLLTEYKELVLKYAALSKAVESFSTDKPHFSSLKCDPGSTEESSKCVISSQRLGEESAVDSGSHQVFLVKSDTDDTGNLQDISQPRVLEPSRDDGFYNLTLADVEELHKKELFPPDAQGSDFHHGALVHNEFIKEVGTSGQESKILGDLQLQGFEGSEEARVTDGDSLPSQVIKEVVTSDPESKFYGDLQLEVFEGSEEAAVTDGHSLPSPVIEEPVEMLKTSESGTGQIVEKNFVGSGFEPDDAESFSPLEGTATELGTSVSDLRSEINQHNYI